MENENVKRFTPVLFPASLEGRSPPNRAQGQFICV